MAEIAERAETTAAPQQPPAAKPAVGLQQAVHVLVATQHTLLTDVERIAAVLSQAEQDPENDIGVYAEELSQSRERVTQISATLQQLLQRLETVEKKLLAERPAS
jgi:vacuolar-type H+-ATPase subunit I/STV1